MRILHKFNWKLKDINVDRVAEQGFDAIQINPLQPLKSNDNEWWLSYQMLDFTIGNRFGSKEDLIELCSNAKQKGVVVILDVVLNHVAGLDTGEVYPHEKVSERLRNNPYFFKSFDRIYNWNDRKEVITKSMGVPGLSLKNKDLQKIIFDFMEEAIECGVGGFRLDAAKNIELPSEGSDFWTEFNRRFEHRGLFNYAEIIFSDKKLMSEYSKYVRVLTEGYLPEEDRLITFVESHDTYLEFLSTREMSQEMLLDEYSVITERFNHTLFYARPFDNLWENDSVKRSNLKNK